jgi:hypothetical protein
MANPNTPSLKPSIRPLLSARLLLEAMHHGQQARTDTGDGTSPAE